MLPHASGGQENRGAKPGERVRPREREWLIAERTSYFEWQQRDTVPLFDILPIREGRERGLSRWREQVATLRQRINGLRVEPPERMQ
jgi:hypothetical protein